MSNFYLVDFYNSVKDSGWPEIETYDDFLELPEYIREECINTHNLTTRFDQIESPEYWQNLLTTVLQYENLAYVPVAKCASTYYITFLNLSVGKRSIF
jgi:hypothetical protein